MSNTPELNKALAKAQAEMKTAAKDALNPHFKSKYADLASVWDAWREVGPSNGLAIVQAPVDAPDGKLRLETTLLHSSGEERTSVLTFPVSQQTPQGYGSALTYARRYGMAAMVGIVPDEDDDGNAASRPAAKPPAPPSPRMPIHDVLSDLRAAIEAAKSPAELTALTPRLRALPETERAALRPAFEARLASLPKVS
jgi:hypothetical protein